MDVVGVMAAYSDPWCVCVYFTVQEGTGAFLYSELHTRTTGKYAAITPTTSMLTDTIEPYLYFNRSTV